MKHKRESFDPHPLLRHLELTLPEVYCTRGDAHPFGGDKEHRVSDGQIAETVGVSIRAVQRWRHGALLSVRDADRYACGLGLHPALLWSEWYSS